MNSKKRREYSRKYQELTSKWLTQYEPLVAAVIRKQIKAAAAKLAEGGERALRGFLDTLLIDEGMDKVLRKLFKKFAIEYANRTYSRLITLSRRRIKAESGAFGFNAEWSQAIEDYLNNFLLTRAVLPVTESTKKQILKVLIEGQRNGWGVDRTIQELFNKDQRELTLFRARRIIRTELVVASNFADKLVQDKVPFETDKIWISIKDNRTRDSHEKMDGVTVDGNADFQVPIIRNRVQIGVEPMTGPGDPAATPGNIINCRCTKALIPRRDKNGRLIRKTQTILP